MIGISTLTFDINGHVVIREDPQTINPTLERRVTRTATLDGESTMNDLGFSYGDMIYTVKASSLDQIETNKLIDIMKTYPLVRIMTREGAFIGVISRMSTGKTPVEFTLLIKNKISA